MGSVHEMSLLFELPVYGNGKKKRKRKKRVWSRTPEPYGNLPSGITILMQWVTIKKDIWCFRCWFVCPCQKSTVGLYLQNCMEFVQTDMSKKTKRPQLLFSFRVICHANYYYYFFYVPYGIHLRIFIDVFILLWWCITNIKTNHTVLVFDLPTL